MECGWLLQTLWCWPGPGRDVIILVLTAVQVGLVTMSLQDNRYSLFCIFFSLYGWKSVTPLKVKPERQSLGKGLLCIFLAIGIILLQGAEPTEPSIANRAQR